MLELLADPHAWAALATLTALEIVLGVDNIVFISILVARLDEAHARRARQIGLSLALLFRLILLGSLAWLMGLTAPVVTILGNELSWRDLILIGGGFFLIAKATHEIHSEVEARDAESSAEPAPARAFALVVAQLALIDLVFSLDSIITALGMADQLAVMVAAVVIAMLVMYFASGPVGGFIAAHPSAKMLALAFLVLIGVALVADGFAIHFPRGYIYASMAFAAMVEGVNMLARRNRRRRGAMDRSIRN